MRLGALGDWADYAAALALEDCTVYTTIPEGYACSQRNVAKEQAYPTSALYTELHAGTTYAEIQASAVAAAAQIAADPTRYGYTPQQAQQLVASTAAAAGSATPATVPVTPGGTVGTPAGTMPATGGTASTGATTGTGGTGGAGGTACSSGSVSIAGSCIPLWGIGLGAALLVLLMMGGRR